MILIPKELKNKFLFSKFWGHYCFTIYINNLPLTFWVWENVYINQYEEFLPCNFIFSEPIIYSVIWTEYNEKVIHGIILKQLLYYVPCNQILLIYLIKNNCVILLFFPKEKLTCWVAEVWSLICNKQNA